MDLLALISGRKPIDLKKALSDYLDSGFDPVDQYAQFGMESPIRKGDVLGMGLNVAPGVGDVKSLVDALQAAGKGNFGEAAMGALGGLPMIPAMGGTFIGKRGAQAMGLLDKFDEAAAMEKAGDSPRNIWDKLMMFRNPADKQWRMEIDDSNALMFDHGDRPYRRVGNLLEHPQLAKAYPETDTMPVDVGNMPDYRGAYFRADKAEGTPPRIGLNKDLFDGAQNEEAKSTLLHELQHHIQSQEGFASGGSQDFVRANLAKFRNRDLEPTWKANLEFETALSNIAPGYAADRIKYYDELSRRDGIKPSLFHTQSAFYEHADDIRSLYGPMPKKPGNPRDGWLKSAFGYLRDREIEDAQKKYTRSELDPYLQMDRRELKNAMARADRRLGKFRGQAVQHDRTQRKYDDLGKMGDHELYKNIAGEAEARLVQDRMNMTMDERKAAFPLAMDEWSGAKLRNLIGYNLDSDPASGYAINLLTKMLKP